MSFHTGRLKSGDYHRATNSISLLTLVLGPELGWTWVSTKAVKAFLSKEQRLISFKFGFEMYWWSMGNGPDLLHLPLSKLLWLPDKFPHTPKCQSCFNSSPLLPPSLSLSHMSGNFDEPEEDAGFLVIQSVNFHGTNICWASLMCHTLSKALCLVINKTDVIGCWILGKHHLFMTPFCCLIFPVSNICINQGHSWSDFISITSSISVVILSNVFTLVHVLPLLQSSVY